MAPRPAFVVPVHDLDVVGRDLRAPLTKEWLDLALEGSELRAAEAEGWVDVHVSKTGHDVLVRGVVHAELEIACARCLEPVRMGGDLELTLLLRPAKKVPQQRAPGQGSPARPIPHRERVRKDDKKPSKSGRARDEDEYEFTAEEADTDVYEGDSVTLDGFVREVILLETPIFPLCSEACEGIRPPPIPTSLSGEGADASPQDPRLSRIAELLAEKQTKKKE